ncbi:MAG TPA: hypothetical protein VFO38_04485 [Candidatus Saccharimonadales bacterium]|nr:hypothetical protein [Candidatus Saccharimonadales bacterium]
MELRSRYAESEFRNLEPDQLQVTWSVAGIYRLLNHADVGEDLSEGYNATQLGVDEKVWFQGTEHPCSFETAHLSSRMLVVSFRAGNDTVTTVAFAQWLTGKRFEWRMARVALVLPLTDPPQWRTGDEDEPNRQRSARVFEYLSLVYHGGLMFEEPFKPIPPHGPVVEDDGTNGSGK